MSDLCRPDRQANTILSKLSFQRGLGFEKETKALKEGTRRDASFSLSPSRARVPVDYFCDPTGTHPPATTVTEAPRRVKLSEQFGS